MKKIISLVLCALICICALASCGDKPAKTTEAAVQTTEAVAETTEAVAETTEAAVETAEAVVETTEAAVETTEAAVETTEAAKEPIVGFEEGTEDAVAIITEVFDPLANGNVTAVPGYDESLDADTKAMLEAIYAHFDYEVLGAKKVADDKVEIAVTLETIDFETVLTNYVVEALGHMDDESWDEDGSYFLEMLKADDAPTTNFETSVFAVLVDGVWDVDVNSEENADFFNAITGGAVSAVSGLE